MKTKLIIQCLFICTIICTAKGLQGNFIVFGDYHLDPTYQDLTGFTQQSCTADVPQNELGKYGHFYCDPPYTLCVHASIKIKAMVEELKPDFLIWMGDAPGHMMKTRKWNQESKLAVIENVTLLIQEYITGVPVYPLLGNHDYWPINQMPTDGSDQYDRIAAMWDPWLTEPLAKETFKKAGYYTMTISENPKMRIIVPNTNLYYKDNQVTKDMDNPANQFDWIEAELQKAVDQNEKIHLVIHVPTGAIETDRDGHWYMRPKKSDRLTDIITKYAGVILAVHGAHEHTDAIRIYYKNGVPVNTIYISPSISPWRLPDDYSNGRNPAMRLFEYNPQSLELITMKQYYMDLSQANLGLALDWRLEYSFKHAYNLPNMRPASMNNLLNEFKKEGSIYFDKYYKYSSVSIEYDESKYVKPCNCKCKRTHICAIRYMKYDDYMACRDDEDYIDCGASFLWSPYNKFLVIAMSILSLWHFTKMF